MEDLKEQRTAIGSFIKTGRCFTLPLSHFPSHMLKVKTDKITYQILSEANQKYGLLKRTCHFVNDTQRKRILYLTLVRSQFEHCSQI